ncbi:hypothetical protein B0I35DRAFT_512634 [Stachybotrys elegans]|uniref:Uncharacterized protein n=1 Tax=Stachybotrys elegans TaxID=80388 RepID=A0A8K0STK1_9HYPO|nr:hypothetical protein B0I35DRAFT_512634 [Stachybotrys elegans]
MPSPTEIMTLDDPSVAMDLDLTPIDDMIECGKLNDRLKEIEAAKRDLIRQSTELVMGIDLRQVTDPSVIPSRWVLHAMVKLGTLFIDVTNHNVQKLQILRRANTLLCKPVCWSRFVKMALILHRQAWEMHCCRIMYAQKAGASIPMNFFVRQLYIRSTYLNVKMYIERPLPNLWALDVDNFYRTALDGEAALEVTFDIYPMRWCHISGEWHEKDEVKVTEIMPMYTNMDLMNWVMFGTRQCLPLSPSNALVMQRKFWVLFRSYCLVIIPV